MSAPKGRKKENVAGEKYDSNAVPMFQRMRGLADMSELDDPSVAYSQLYPEVPHQFNINAKNWIIVYPTYIDAKKTIAQGRRIPKDKACESPIVDEIAEVCRYFTLMNVLEPKSYPRDYFPTGRVRVQLKDENGNLMNRDIPTRRALLLKLGELIPKLNSRKERLAREASMRSNVANSATSSVSNKKKGKKKGRK